MDDGRRFNAVLALSRLRGAQQWAVPAIRTAILAAFLVSPLVSSVSGAAGSGPGEPEWDLGAVGCTYTQEESGLITLLLDTEVLLPDRDGEWSIPIRILFNGEQVEVDHRGVFKASSEPCSCPPQCDNGTCVNDPARPCGTTTRTYKDEDVVFNWQCVPDGGECKCQRILFFPATLPKTASAPTEPGIFEFIIDPDNEVPELDEGNNSCLLSYEPQNSGAGDGSLQVRALRLVSQGPNPFRENTSFLLALGAETEVRVDIFGTGGRLVRSLTHGRFEAGVQEILWDGTYEGGIEASGGIYYVRARTADGRVASQRILKLEN